MQWTRGGHITDLWQCQHVQSRAKSGRKYKQSAKKKIKIHHFDVWTLLCSGQLIAQDKSSIWTSPAGEYKTHISCLIWYHRLMCAKAKRSEEVFNFYFQRDFHCANETPSTPLPLHIVISPQAWRICFQILPNIGLTVPGTVAMEATSISSFPLPNMVTGLMNSTFH